MDLKNIAYETLFVLGAILLILGARHFDSYLDKKFGFSPRAGLLFIIVVIIFSILFGYLLLPQRTDSSLFNIHAQHLQLAKQAKNGTIGGVNISSLPGAATNPGLIGDPTRRFSVSFNQPQNISPNQDVTLDFQVFDANTGNEQDLFNFVYSKVVHLVIVDNELNYFNHIHPTQTGSHFQITTQFPHPGRYHLYLDFQPLGAIEQQFGFTLNVGAVNQPAQATEPPDKTFTKTFGDYTVSMVPATPMKASDLSIGNQTVTFALSDAKTLKPITTLKPYLAAYGHLVLINEKSYEYIHVHPTNLFPPTPDSNGGPTVEFLPLGLYGPIKPGVYRLFAQFNPDNNLFTADYTVEVK